MACVLDYYIEYTHIGTLPGDLAAFVHTRTEMPIYLDRVSKEIYFDHVTLGAVCGDPPSETVTSLGGTVEQFYQLANDMTYAGTLVGEVWLNASPAVLLYTFTTAWDGNMTFTQVTPDERAIVNEGYFLHVTNRIRLRFAAAPSFPVYMKVAYNYAEGVLPAEPSVPVSGFATGLFNLQGVTEIAVQAYRLWFARATNFTWDDVMPNVLEYVKINTGNTSINEIKPPITLKSMDHRRNVIQTG